MSAIFGIISLDGSPAVPGEVARIADALTHQGVEDASLYAGDSFVLGSRMMRITPESVYEENPFYDQPSGQCITASARLDNRDDLCRILGIPPADRSMTPDNRLILAAYRKWGESCPEHLIGDFAFVIWDKTKKQIFGATDPMGGCRLYYACLSDRFIFATAVAGILAVSDFTARLNRRYAGLYPYIVSGFDDAGATFFEDIFLLQKAHALSWNRQGLKKRLYWTPTPAADLRFKSHAEWLEAFRDVYFQAVADRLRSDYPAASLLSGGLDSSGIVAAAAHILKEKNRSLKVFAGVLPAQTPTGISDERTYIDQFSGRENIEIEYITGEQTGPFDNYEALIERAGFPRIQPTHYMITAFGEAAKRYGARCLLDGTNGELGPSYYAIEYFSELVLKGRWLKCADEIRKYLRHYRSSLYSVIRWQIINPLVPVPIRLMRKRSSAFNVQQMLDQFPMQQAFIMQAIGDELPDVLKMMRLSGERRPNHRINQIAQIKASRTMFYDVYTDHLSWSLPYHDTRLLEFCMAAPGDLKFHDGYSRYLIRGGLDGILPPEIQWRTTKEPFSTDYHLRYNRQRPGLAAMLEDISPSDPVRELVDVDRLKSAVRYEMTESFGRTPENFAALHVVPLGVYMIHFFRQFEGYKAP